MKIAQPKDEAGAGCERYPCIPLPIAHASWKPGLKKGSKLSSSAEQGSGMSNAFRICHTQRERAASRTAVNLLQDTCLLRKSIRVR